MHRSQILLEEWQYQYLTDESRRSGESISAIVRRWITERIEEQHQQAISEDPFFEIIGICSGEPGNTVGQDHDKVIYTTDWSESGECPDAPTPR